MNEHERYATIDLPFYHERIAPLLPPAVLDFHTHCWRREDVKAVPWETGATGGRYMVTTTANPIDTLLADGRRLFPDRPYNAVCFGWPTPTADLRSNNAYLAELRKPGFFPLRITGRGETPPNELEREILKGGFFGYKVYLPWHGDDYGQLTVSEMLGPEEMAVADALGLVVLLHVPRAGRLADPEIAREVVDYALRYPNARLLLAHCGRCYLPEEMHAAIEALRGVDNVFLDTAMVMDPVVLQMVFRALGPRRVVFATDLPVAAMRGRRVQVMDHWVDMVLSGYPASAFRAASDDIHATFMVYEIILAIHWAAELAGLTAAETAAIYHDNGMGLLEHVCDGEQLRKMRE